jgi:hypothetical protein
MAITRPERVKFMFQNANGVHYEVNIIRDTGVGFARKHGLTRKSTPMFGAPEAAITVDAGPLATWKKRDISYVIHAGVYNGGQSLDTILNAAS